MSLRKVVYLFILVLVFGGNIYSLVLLQQDITHDTTWYTSDSPVYIYGNLTITNNAVLMIKPGVEVLFMEISGDGGFEDGSEIHLEDGALIASGRDSQPILFSSAEDVPMEGDWGCIAVEGDNVVNLEYCVIEYAKTGLYLYNLSTFSETTSIINYNGFYDNSEQGILFYNSSPQINNNIISDNNCGIKTVGTSYPVITYNDICDNFLYNLKNSSYYDQTAENNWWGTTLESLIELYIYDENDDSTCGYVDYKPYLYASITEGGGGNFQTASLGLIRTYF